MEPIVKLAIENLLSALKWYDRSVHSTERQKELSWDEVCKCKDILEQLVFKYDK